MNVKKLDLTGDKKNALIACLNNAAGCLDTDMARIYRDTACQAAFAGDRIHLDDAQVGITCFALRTAITDSITGLNKVLVSDMLAQLTMTRREYAALARNGE